MKNTASTILIATILMAGVRIASADHRGSLGVLTNPSANIGDAYAFVDPNDPSMVVLAMTVNGFTPAGLNPIFGTDCLYQFKIDNTGDFVEDLVIQVLFDKPVGSPFSPTQGFTVIGPIKPPKTGPVSRVAKTKAAPVTGTIVNVPQTGPGAGIPVNSFTLGANGVGVFCGVRDDPFNFDEIFFRNILRGTLASPVPPNTNRSTPGVDFYAKMNTSTIAVELPASMLTGTLVNSQEHKQLNVWATTSLPATVRRSVKPPRRGAPPEEREVDAKTFAQHDRAALPLVGTFLVDDANKAAFNGGQPRDDAKVFAEPARALIQKMQLSPTDPAAIAAADHLLAIRFPDVLRLDVTSTAGFPADNGRRPQDDVVSFELGLLTVGAVTNEGIPGSDGQVGGNDAPLLTTFPFFGAPHVPSEPVPARN